MTQITQAIDITASWQSLSALLTLIPGNTYILQNTGAVDAYISIANPGDPPSPNDSGLIIRTGEPWTTFVEPSGVSDIFVKIAGGIPLTQNKGQIVLSGEIDTFYTLSDDTGRNFIGSSSDPTDILLMGP